LRRSELELSDENAARGAKIISAKAQPGIREEDIRSVRAVLQAIARMIATDRRAVVLATDVAEVLLANAPARRLGLESEQLTHLLDWSDLCARARRSGSAPVSLEMGELSLEGELVRLPLGQVTGYLLRLSETDQEATWLRNRARTATLLRVAHDLRTPIQSLLASAETLLDPQRRKDADEQQFRRAADLALDHISNVLAVIRGEQSGGGLQPDEEFSVADELERLLEVVKPIIRARGAFLQSAVYQAEAYRVFGPVRFVRALFQNMIDNSVKYGGEKIDIELSLAPLPKSLDAKLDEARLGIALEVRDLGGGLPEEQKERLRASLGQAARGYVTTAQGSKGRVSGGLNVLAHALLQLGGRLDVMDRGEGDVPVSRPDESVTGTILRATFSLALAEPTAKPATGGERPAEQNVLEGKALLLIEDSPAGRDWLAHVLRRAGATVHPVSSGPEALLFLTEPTPKERVNLILSDVTLPKMSGIELAARIRKAGKEGQIARPPAIIGLTAHVDERIRKACLAAGMVRVLEKPIRPVQLLDAIQEVLMEQPATRAADEAESSRVANLAGNSSVLEPSVVADLLSELGRDRAEHFMTRAHSEAEDALNKLQKNGVTDDTARMLHAATGACGLTGLMQLEKILRELESAIKEPGADLSELTELLKQALTDSTVAISAALK